MKDIETGLTEVSVLGCVVNGVIVVPESPSVLRVGVVIVLVLIYLGDVFSPAIERSTSWGVELSVELKTEQTERSDGLTIGSMKMDRVGTVCMVDEAHNSFTALGHPHGWARGDSIVSDQTSFAKVGIDLLLKRLDVDLIVVDWRVAVAGGKLPIYELDEH